MAVTNTKQHLLRYIDEVIKNRVQSYVEEELKKLNERITKQREQEIKDLKDRLPAEAEKIAADVAIEIQLQDSFRDFTTNLNIQVISK